MGRLLIRFLAFLGVASAFAATDYTCVNNCQQKGYQYQLCLERCSYDESPSGARSTGYWSGYLEAQQAIGQMRQQQLQNQQLEMRNQMIRNADAACQKGNQRACNDLRIMLFGK